MVAPFAPFDARIDIPRAVSTDFMSVTVVTPSCRMPASNAAEAPPEVSTSSTSSAEPPPPEATTGTDTREATSRVSCRSYPMREPSRSMLVSRISPAPRRAHSAAHSTASRSLANLPPCVYTRHPPPSRAASMLATRHWLP